MSSANRDSSCFICWTWAIRSASKGTCFEPRPMSCPFGSRRFSSFRKRCCRCRKNGTACRTSRCAIASGIWASSPMKSRSEEHTSELQSQSNLVCRLLLEKKKKHVRSFIADTRSRRTKAVSSRDTHADPFCHHSYTEPHLPIILQSSYTLLLYLSPAHSST